MHAQSASGSDTNSDGTDVHRKQVEYGGTDEGEEEKAPQQISHRRGGKGSGDGDEDVDHKKVVKKVQENPENDASDSSNLDFPRGILVDKGKAQKRSPLFDWDGQEETHTHRNEMRHT